MVAGNDIILVIKEFNAVENKNWNCISPEDLFSLEVLNYIAGLRVPKIVEVDKSGRVARIYAVSNAKALGPDNPPTFPRLALP